MNNTAGLENEHDVFFFTVRMCDELIHSFVFLFSLTLLTLQQDEEIQNLSAFSEKT